MEIIIRVGSDEGRQCPIQLVLGQQPVWDHVRTCNPLRSNQFVDVKRGSHSP